MEPGFYFHRTVIGNHDPAVSVLPPIIPGLELQSFLSPGGQLRDEAARDTQHQSKNLEGQYFSLATSPIRNNLRIAVRCGVPKR